jgi:hypothetical protein
MAVYTKRIQIIYQQISHQTLSSEVCGFRDANFSYEAKLICCDKQGQTLSNSGILGKKLYLHFLSLYLERSAFADLTFTLSVKPFPLSLPLIQHS